MTFTSSTIFARAIAANDPDEASQLLRYALDIHCDWRAGEVFPDAAYWRDLTPSQRADCIHAWLRFELFDALPRAKLAVVS